ncbi:MAG TPA: dienelactone hydrolase family protein [Burkholderiaceae bacterium]|nr:dienelactone hydrolase family protein [Burkholderiaceae bacterium]
MTEQLECLEIETGANPQSSVIWLHGLGADGNDFAPIVPELDLDGCGSVRFVFPHAPRIPITVNGGYVMRAWYDILGIDLARREDEGGLRASLKQVDAVIEREKQRGVPARRIVLAGFSQGCAMTLLTGLRHVERLGGLIGLSGYLPLSGTTKEERHQANHDVPVFLAHGTTDPVVPLARALEARDVLNQLGYSVEWHTYAMPHSVCAEEVMDISKFLRSVLA